MRNFLSILLAIAAGAGALAAKQLSLHSDGPQPGHSGGFGEPTCHACHFDYALNEGDAEIRVDSLPDSYESARSYPLRLVVRHAELKRGGFQITARYEDGTSAGSFEISDTAHLRVQRAKGITYLSHSAGGSKLVHGDSIVWRFKWLAPAGDRRVVFNVAANVANDDASEFGDRIYTREFFSGGERVKK